MDSNSLESGDDSNPQNGEYTEDQITEQMIALNLNGSESEDDDRNPQNGEFNKDQIEELLACLIKIIKMLPQSESLKNNAKHEERKLIKKRNRARNANVYNAQNEIRKLCNVFKNIGCSVSDNQADVRTSNLSLAEAVAGTSRSITEAIPRTSRSHAEAILRTSRGHSEAIPGNSRTHTEEIPATFRSHTEAIPESYRSHTEAIPGTSRNHTESIPGTSRSYTKTIPGTSRGYTKTIPGTSRGYTKTIPGTSRGYTKTIPETSRGYTKTIPGTSRGYTKTIPGTSRGYTKTIPGTSRGYTKTIPGTSRGYTKAIPGTSRGYTKAIPGTSRGYTKAIPGTSRGYTKAIPGTSRGYTKAIPGTSRGYTKSISGTSRSHTEPEVIGKSTNQTIPVVDTLGGNTDTDGTGTHKNQASTLEGNCRDRIGAVPVTARSHNEPIGKSRSDTDAIAVNSRRHVKPTDGASRILTVVVPRAPRCTDAVLGASRGHTGEIAGTSRSHSETAAYSTISAPETSRSLTGTSRSHTEATLGHYRNQAGATETSISHTKNMNQETCLVGSRNFSSLTKQRAETAQYIEYMPGKLLLYIPRRNTTEAVNSDNPSRGKLLLYIPRRNTTEAVNSDNPSRVAEQCVFIAKATAPGTSRHKAGAVSSASRRVTGTVVPDATRNQSKDNISQSNSKSVHSSIPSVATSVFETELLAPRTSESSREIISSNTSSNRTIVAQSQTLRRQKQTTNINVNISGDNTRQKERTNLHCNETKMDVSKNDQVNKDITDKKRNTDKSLKTLIITYMDMLRNQKGAKKRTASILSRYIEQGSAISSLTKIMNTHKNNKSTDGSKRKLTENCALNGRTEEIMNNSTSAKIADAEKSKKAEDFKKRKALNVIGKPDSTLKSPMEEVISNSAPVKTAIKENKSVDEIKRKTKAKDSTQNAHVERVITNSKLTNDKRAADTKRRTATRLDKYLSMRNRYNQRIKGTMSNSTITKMLDTKKSKEPRNGKKRKILGADSGSQKNTYYTIDLTSGNDINEPKASTITFKNCSPGPAEDDKKIQDAPIIDLSDDTCFYNPNEEKNQSVKVIQKPITKSEDNDQVLKGQQVIDVDEDTCLLTPEEFTNTNSGPISKDHDKILKVQPVIDLNEDTCLYDVSQQNTSVAIKKSTPNPECDDEQATNSTNSINEICRSKGENVSATRLESNGNMNEHRTKVLEELEVKWAENLLAAKIEKEQASKDPGSSNTIVVSSFFNAPPIQNNHKLNHKITELNATHIKQRLQGNCNSLKNRHDKVIHASKRPYEKSKNNKNKLKPNKIFPEVTLTTKTPTGIPTPTPQKQKTIRPTTERHSSNAPVNEPELSISIRPTPNRPITNSAIESIVLQAAQIAIPKFSITTSDDKTPTTERLLTKLNPVTSKRSSTDSEPFAKRDETKPGGQRTNPTKMIANIQQNVLLPSDRMQNIAESDCGMSDVTKTPKGPTTDSGSSKRDTRTKSREKPTNSFENKTQTVPPLTFSETNSSTMQQSAQITRTDSSNFSSTSAESQPEKPKPVTKASKRPSPVSGGFPQPREPYPFQSGKHNQAPASPEWAPALRTALLSQSRHHPAGNGMLSTNSDFATRQPTNPRPVSISSTSHAAQESPKLASGPPQVCSAPTDPRKGSNRRETNFNKVQSPQIDWYQPAPINLTPHGNSRSLNSNVFGAHSNRKSSIKNYSHPIQSWHTPVLSGNERPDLPQTLTVSRHPSPSLQSSLPYHLRPPIQEQLACQRIPTGRDPVKELYPPSRPFLVLRNQAAMMDNQRAPITSQPTWHIPTKTTDI